MCQYANVLIGCAVYAAWSLVHYKGGETMRVKVRSV